MKRTKLLMVNGILQCIEKMGAELHKLDDNFLYIIIKTGSEIDDKEKLEMTKYALNDLIGIGLKVKRVS